MDDIKKVIANNLTELRKKNGLTQIDLAEKLNYSDKAVSKWERGESLPDIIMFKKLADLYGVSLDSLVSADSSFDSNVVSSSDNSSDTDILRRRKNHTFITLMSVFLVWLIATILYIGFKMHCPGSFSPWLFFVLAVPVSCIVWLVLNSVWFSHRRNFLIISLLMWSTLCASFLTLLSFGINFWLLFLIGIPGQIIILMWSGIRKK